MQKGVVRKRPPAKPSSYGQQLQEKQSMKREYQLRERQFKSLVKGVLGAKKKGEAGELLLQNLEIRLDSLVFRMGMAQTRDQARQLVSHGHVAVNGKPVNVPSYRLKVGDRVALRPSSAKRPFFANVKVALQKYQPPSWIELEREKIEAKLIKLPTREEIKPSVEIPLIFEFYSR